MRASRRRSFTTISANKFPIQLTSGIGAPQWLGNVSQHVVPCGITQLLSNMGSEVVHVVAVLLVDRRADAGWPGASHFLIIPAGTSQKTAACDQRLIALRSAEC